jgi:hypothetical protein
MDGVLLRYCTVEIVDRLIRLESSPCRRLVPGAGSGVCSRSWLHLPAAALEYVIGRLAAAPSALAPADQGMAVSLLVCAPRVVVQAAERCIFLHCMD